MKLEDSSMQSKSNDNVNNKKLANNNNHSEEQPQINSFEKQNQKISQQIINETMYQHKPHATQLIDYFNSKVQKQNGSGVELGEMNLHAASSSSSSSQNGGVAKSNLKSANTEAKREASPNLNAKPANAKSMYNLL